MQMVISCFPENKRFHISATGICHSLSLMQKYGAPSEIQAHKDVQAIALWEAP